MKPLQKRIDWKLVKLNKQESLTESIQTRVVNERKTKRTRRGDHSNPLESTSKHRAVF